MSLRFQYLCIIFGHILCAVNCCVSLQINSQPVPFLANPCDEDLLKSAVNNVFLFLSMQGELMAMKEQLVREIKEIKKSQESVPPATKKPSSCTEAMRQENGKYAESGVYELYLPEFLHHPFNVYCLRDPNRGEPWTIIQRRQSNDTDFYRGWIEYEHGFGNLNANFFLGLDKIHALTHSRSHQLWIQLVDFENQKSIAKYESFAIGNAQDKYELIALGQYSGTAGDSFSYHSGSKFSTKDSDNDKSSGNCAVYSKGAWWYKNCYDSTLNGIYLGGEYPKSQEGRGVVWRTWRGEFYSLKYVLMAIRPKYYY
ncbi:ryncolin-2 isoform X2 [Bactrocera dorsalis]|uniref:Ryncolin-2 isoform X2 n=1 Tax=Bactrocera dorsalis TaxID=27457 RepID=A0ABM3IZB9_BACDO|nr:ryncolin-2 isoform X2 [Bactrocera dorsalis]